MLVACPIRMPSHSYHFHRWFVAPLLEPRAGLILEDSGVVFSGYTHDWSRVIPTCIDRQALTVIHLYEAIIWNPHSSIVFCAHVCCEFPAGRPSDCVKHLPMGFRSSPGPSADRIVRDSTVAS